MNLFDSKRIFIEGPRILDLTHLLYCDKIILFKGTQKYNEYSPSSQEAELEEKLKDANFIISKDELLEKGVLSKFDSDYDVGREHITESFREYTNLPFCEPHAANWSFINQQIKVYNKYFCSKLREFANIVSNKYTAIPTFELNNFSEVYTKGNKYVLSIIFSQLPTLNFDTTNIDDLIEFLKDEETIIKRQRLFSWQNNIENRIEKGDIKKEDILDEIATHLFTYTEHLKLSEQKFKYGIYECIVNLPKAIVLALSIIGIPKALNNILQFKKRELDLKEEELKAPYRELAYIIHASRKFENN